MLFLLLNKKTYFLLFSLFLISFSSLHAQNNKVIRNVKAEGSWDVTGDVSPAMAKEKALLKAKKNALRKAGIPTDVKTLAFAGIVNGDEMYEEEDFTQLNSIYISGRVIVKEEEYSQRLENGIFVVTAKIVANVYSEAEKDPEFVLDVKGFKNVYKEGDELEFSIKAYKDCYLRVFWFENTLTGEGYLLYPAEDYNSDIMLNAKQIYDFPLSPDIDKGKPEISYKLVADSNECDKNIFFIVATKERIPFVEDVNFVNFFKWYNKIDGDKKTEICGKRILIIK